MASREREQQHAVATAPPPKPIRDSAFRRGAGDFEERQLPGPRRFGFGTSPPRRLNSHSHNNNNSSNNTAMIYSPPRASDTARQTTILPPSSASSSAARQGRSPPGASRAAPSGRADLRVVSNDVRALSSAPSGPVAAQIEPIIGSEPERHPVFSQLALVLGYELAKKVTERHPREHDLNRLANLALDIGNVAAPAAAAVAPAAASAAAAVAAPAAAEPAAPAAATPARSSSATSQASQSSTTTERRRVGGGNFNRPGNRSPMDDSGRIRFGRGAPGASRAPLQPLGGGRAAAPPPRANNSSSSSPAAVDDSFVTAVSAASVAAVVDVAAPPSPPPQMVVVDDAAAAAAATVTDDVRTDTTAAEEDLIDWDGEADAPAQTEEVHAAAPPLVVQPSHLLD